MQIPDPTSHSAFDVRRSFIFRDRRPFAQCHASTLASAPDGRLLVAWFGGTHEGHSDTGIFCADRKGTEWSEPRLIARVADIAHWNPVLFARSADGRELTLHFKVGARIRSWATWAQHSKDGGRTWTDAEPLVDGDQGGRGAVKNKAIQLSGGDFLAGASIEDGRTWDAFMDRSADGVRDWVATGKIEITRSGFSGKGLIQPSLWESSPGHVHALFRSTNGWIHRSDSRDDGRSWSKAYAIHLPNNNSGLDLVRMSTGGLALTCNPIGGNWAARTPLSLLFSRDNGETWSDRIDIETGPGEFSYPAIIETPDGLAISYTWNRRRIAVATLDRDALPSI